MFEKRIVIKHQRFDNCTKIGALLVVLLFMFSAGFFAAVKLLGHPLPSALPQIEIKPRELEPTSQNHQPIKESRWEYTSLMEERECLAQNIYFEARNQDLRGQIAVGLVTLNRVKSKHYPNSICDVVWQQATDKNTGRLTAQFSWTLDGKTDTILDKEAYDKIKRIAGAMIAGARLNNIVDFTHGATHYHADYVTPYWMATMAKTVKVGMHIFYKNG